MDRLKPQNRSVITMVTRAEIEQGLKKKKKNSEITILLIRNNLLRTPAFLHCLLGTQYSKTLNYDVTFSVILIFAIMSPAVSFLKKSGLRSLKEYVFY